MGRDEGLDHSAAVGSRFGRVAAAAVVLPHRLLEHVRVDELLRVEPFAVRGFAPEALPGLSVVAEVSPRVRGGAVRAPLARSAESCSARRRRSSPRPPARCLGSRAPSRSSPTARVTARTAASSRSPRRRRPRRFGPRTSAGRRYCPPTRRRWSLLGRRARRALRVLPGTSGTAGCLSARRPGARRGPRGAGRPPGMRRRTSQS